MPVTYCWFNQGTLSYEKEATVLLPILEFFAVIPLLPNALNYFSLPLEHGRGVGRVVLGLNV